MSFFMLAGNNYAFLCPASYFMLFYDFMPAGTPEFYSYCTFNSFFR